MTNLKTPTLISLIFLGILITLLLVLVVWHNPLGFFIKKSLQKQAVPQVNQTKLTDEQLKNEIGQMVMIGFRGVEVSNNFQISKIIQDVKIGGIVLFDYDIPTGSFPRNIVNPEQTKKLISDIQSYSSIPLLVAVDAEGGSVNRLKEKYGFTSIVSAEQMGKDKTLKTTDQQSLKLASELKSLGFNMNLAPVIDLNTNPNNPAIGAVGRSFSADPQEVFRQSEVFIKNHLSNNIITVEKHFPGLGSATDDTHKGAADITNTYSQDELLPYRELNDAGLLNAVMVGHIINKKVDESYPASLSSAFLLDILREQIGFKGVIISDDMQMGAISDNYTLDDAIVKSINAGCDIVSVLNNSPQGYDDKIAYKVRDMIFNAVKNGKIKEEKITESYNRIIGLKTEFKIILSEEEKNNQLNTIKNGNFELLNSQSITFEQAVSMARNVEKITASQQTRGIYKTLFDRPNSNKH